MHPGGYAFTEEVGGEVVREGGGAEDGPGHGFVDAFFFKVYLDSVFAGEVGDVGWVGVGVGASVDGGENEDCEGRFSMVAMKTDGCLDEKGLEAVGFISLSGVHPL